MRILLGLLLLAGGQDAQARALYEKALTAFETRTREGLSSARSLFQRASEIDPHFADAHAGLADATCLLALYGYEAPLEVMPRAREAALESIRLAPGLARAHASLGLVRYLFEWRFDEAEESFRRAIELDPSYPSVRHWYAMLLMVRGRFDESLQQIDEARALDPDSALYPEKRRTILAAAGRLSEKDPASDSHLRSQLTALEQEAASRYVSPLDLAVLHARLGEKEAALSAIERAFELRDASLVYLRSQPELASLRSEPRFQAILKRMGI
jgi:tetratricopeptide (TPR) repeat protein